MGGMLGRRMREAARWLLAAMIACLVGLVGLAGLACMAGPALAGEAEDLARVKEALLREEMAGQKASLEEIRNWAARLGPGGRWPDVDYQDKAPARWKTRAHLDRAVAMAKAASGPGKGDAALLQASLQALDHWLEMDYQASNWWFNEISTPTRMGRLLLLLQPHLDKPRLDKGLAIVARAWPRETQENWEANQNQVDRAVARLHQGVLAKDFAMLREAFDSILFTLQPRAGGGRHGEGIQVDLSYHMHGPILYSGGYGLEYPRIILQVARLAQGTSLTLPRDRFDLLQAYMLDHQRWIARARWLDPAVLGRNISRPQADDALAMDDGLALLETFPNARKAEIAAFRAELKGPAGMAGAGRSTLSGNRHFWRSDYMTQRRPGFLASVKMVSTRTRGSESGNNENLKGEHLSQGSFFLLRRGDEYSGLFPVWNWRMIPGVTAAQDPGAFDLHKWGRGSEGRRDFVGGVSDGQDGLAAMDFEYQGLRAVKTWAFLGDVAVGMVAGLEDGAGSHPVFTTLEQRLWRGSAAGVGGDGKPLTPFALLGFTAAASPGNVTVSPLLPARTDPRPSPAKKRNATTPAPIAPGPAGAAAPVPAVSPLRQARWFWNDNTGWLRLDEGLLQVRVQEQRGSWREINQNHDAVSVSRPVLSVWLDHGAAPRQASAAWLVAMDHAEAAMRALAAKPPVEILGNAPALQAARRADQGLTLAAFHQPGTLSLGQGRTVTVNAPCLLLLREEKQGWTLAASNPRNAPLTLEVRLSWKATGSGAVWDAASGTTRLTLALPEGDMAGKSARISLAR